MDYNIVLEASTGSCELLGKLGWSDPGLVRTLPLGLLVGQEEFTGRL